MDWVDFGVRDVSGNIDSLSLGRRRARVQRPPTAAAGAAGPDRGMAWQFQGQTAPAPENPCKFKGLDPPCNVSLDLPYFSCRASEALRKRHLL